MAKASRDKGAAGEREVVDILRKAYDPNHTRGMMPVDRIRRGLQGQGDERGERVPDVVAPGLWCEVKRHARITRGVVLGGLEQAERASEGTGLIPCCWHRSDRGAWEVTLRLGEAAAMEEGYRFKLATDTTPITMTGEDFASLWAAWERGR